MSLLLAWVLFPLVLAAIGLGWGVISERLAGDRVDDALLLPLGLAAALVLAGTLNGFDATAPAAVPAVAIVALVGLALAWSDDRRPGRWALIAAAGTLFAYGAPVILSGEATFAGFIRLDDTATWFNLMDHAMTTLDSEAIPSTWSVSYDSVGETYPRGSFILAAVGRAIVGGDIAWVFQPYLAVCGAAIALCLYALIRPLVPSDRWRAAIAFLAAQPALLYGYSLWGGIKELTAAFLLVLMIAFATAAIRRRPRRAGELLPLAIAAGALIQTLGAGAGAWVALTFAALAALWLVPAVRAGRPWPVVVDVLWLGGLTAACMIPVWVVLSDFLATDASLFASGQSEHVRLGNLGDPLSGFQLAGIWPVGDFRLSPPGLPTKVLVGAVFAAAAAALWLTIRRRDYGLALYVGVALGGCAVFLALETTPWVIGKTLAIASPALLVAALTGAMLIWSRRRAGVALLALLAFGVLWSNALAYKDVLLAPQSRLAELERIGELVDGRAPTLFNEYEIYGNSHFLRKGAPVGPADYRPVDLALRDGTLLTKAAWSDIDSLPLATLEEYDSIVTRRSPSESRPPASFELVWSGDYYDLWQRSGVAVVDHVPFGESNEIPFCGEADNSDARPACSLNPVEVPSCATILELGERAASEGNKLLAHVRPAPVAARGDQVRWPAAWLHDPAGGTLTAREPGTAVSEIAVSEAGDYELWLGGSFARGFEVSVDGESLGRVSNELSSIGGYAPVATIALEPGTHRFELTYPDAGLRPGSGDNWFTSLSAISLRPTGPEAELVEVEAENARQLCGRPLDWVEIVPG